MSIKLMAQVFEMPLKPNEKLVLLAIADCANDDGYAFPGYKKLMNKTSLARATLSKNLKILASAGLFEKESHATIGKGRSVNTYQLKLETILNLEEKLINARKVHSMKSSHGELGKNRKVHSTKSSHGEPRKVQSEGMKSSTVEHESSLLTVSTESSVLPPNPQNEYSQVLSKIKTLDKNIPQAVAISNGREKAIKQCLKKYGLDKVLQMLDKTAQSPMTEQSWFDFDFMWKDTSQSPRFLNILEGKYDQEFNTGGQQASPAGHNISTEFSGYRSSGFGGQS